MIPVIVLLLLVLFGVVAQMVRGPAAATSGSQSSAGTPPARAPVTSRGRAVLRSLAAVRRAYDAGDVRRLCRPRALLDPAVIRRRNAGPSGCESELESMMANVPRLRFTVRRLALRPDLATATVAATSGASVPVDLVRDGRRWLLSFSDGGDPMPALAGTE